MTYLTDHNYILLLEIPSARRVSPSSFLPSAVSASPSRRIAFLPISIRDDILQDFLIYRLPEKRLNRASLRRPRDDKSKIRRVFQIVCLTRLDANLKRKVAPD